MTFHAPEHFRITTGPFATTARDGNNGAFFVSKPGKRGETAPLKVICSDGMGWDHVSVSLPNRTPSWEELCRIKSIFWDAEDAVMQLHPPESTYVNTHSHCLHLWRPHGVAIPLPPSIMVGVREMGTLV